MTSSEEIEHPTVKLDASAEDFKLRLGTFLKRVRKAKHCEGCGGLLPDLVLRFEGIDYFLTATQFVDYDKKTIGKTDYNRLAENLVHKGYGRKKVLETGLQKNLGCGFREQVAGYRMLDEAGQKRAKTA